MDKRSFYVGIGIGIIIGAVLLQLITISVSVNQNSKKSLKDSLEQQQDKLPDDKTGVITDPEKAEPPAVQQPVAPSQQAVDLSQQPVAPSQQAVDLSQQPAVPSQQAVDLSQQPAAPSQQPIDFSQRPAVPSQQPIDFSQQPIAPVGTPVPVPLPSAKVQNDEQEISAAIEGSKSQQIVKIDPGFTISQTAKLLQQEKAFTDAAAFSSLMKEGDKLVRAGCFLMEENMGEEAAVHLVTHQPLTRSEARSLVDKLPNLQADRRCL